MASMLASRILATVALMILCGSEVGYVAAQTSSTSGCTNPALSLTPCLNFLTGSNNGQNNTSPNKGCCDAVGDALNAGVECLCILVTTSNPLGFFNRTLAFRIPGLCNISSEPLNKCEENAGVPFGAPAPSPVTEMAPAPVGDLAPAPAPARASASRQSGQLSPAASLPSSPAPSIESLSPGSLTIVPSTQPNKSWRNDASYLPLFALWILLSAFFNGNLFTV